MPERDIPQNEWNEFVDGFSEEYKGETVTIEVVGPDTASHVVAKELPLDGVSLDDPGVTGSQAYIWAGEEPQDHIQQVIPNPRRISVQEDDQGEPSQLRVEGQDGLVATIRLRQA
jgi:hypothetical protein